MRHDHGRAVTVVVEWAPGVGWGRSATRVGRAACTGRTGVQAGPARVAGWLVVSAASARCTPSGGVRDRSHRLGHDRESIVRSHYPGMGRSAEHGRPFPPPESPILRAAPSSPADRKAAFERPRDRPRSRPDDRAPAVSEYDAVPRWTMSAGAIPPACPDRNTLTGANGGRGDSGTAPGGRAGRHAAPATGRPGGGTRGRRGVALGVYSRARGFVGSGPIGSSFPFTPTDRGAAVGVRRPDGREARVTGADTRPPPSTGDVVAVRDPGRDPTRRHGCSRATATPPAAGLASRPGRRTGPGCARPTATRPDTACRPAYGTPADRPPRPPGVRSPQSIGG
ncbi:hypothetical protein GA0070606_5897 [Micromonospora citrea]|uniref:Uncharacterized protein n=1 Tax=Micromonospora citrea TaxID=47855 RepID=A0A1C6W055_9ACTN|nr:hypothetical protein GA0070606_5897 [Micromonospora citrea]